MSRTLIVVPARLSSQRLPRKVLLPVAGKPLLIWACESAEKGRRLLEQRGEQAKLLVACAEQEIVDCAEQHGFSALLTDADLPSGSDRVSQAAERSERHFDAQVVVNCQADLPKLEARVFADALTALRASDADIATPVVAVKGEQAESDSVVKAILVEEEEKNHQENHQENHKEKHRAKRASEEEGVRVFPVMAFTRALAPWSARGREARYWHHIGVYAYRRQALARFVSLAPSVLEKREGLEQMRALEHGMKIVAFACDSAPVEINLEAERLAFERRIQEAKLENEEKQ